MIEYHHRILTNRHVQLTFLLVHFFNFTMVKYNVEIAQGNRMTQRQPYKNGSDNLRHVFMQSLIIGRTK